jgi:transcriptional regulator with XRE-family HTH domain
MTADEYRKTIDQLGLTQSGAARLLGVDERTSRRWALGERDIPPPAERFLRYLLLTGRSGESAVKKLASIETSSSLPHFATNTRARERPRKSKSVG